MSYTFTTSLVIGGRTINAVTGLTNGDTLTIPDTISGDYIVSITSCTFTENNITLVSNASRLKTIFANAFINCKLIGDLSLPYVTDIGDNAFDSCKFTGSLSLPSVLNIGNSAFASCKFAGSLSLPVVTTIGNSAFDSCMFTGSLSLPAATDIDYSAFYKSGFDGGSLSLPLITTIKENTFFNCGFSSVYIPNVTTFGPDCFKNCFLLTGELTLGNNISIVIGSFDGTNVSIFFRPSLSSDFSLTFTNIPVTTTSTFPKSLSFAANILSGTITETGIFPISFSNGITFSATIEIQAPCLLSTCSILTTESYKPISEIKAGDSIISAFSKSPKRVLHCGYNVVDLKLLESTNHPMVIPKNHFKEGIPSRDVYISGHHRVICPATGYNYIAIQTFKLGNFKTLSKEEVLEITGQDEVRYYHIEVEGGKDTMFCDGLPIETLDAGEWPSNNFEN